MNLSPFPEKRKSQRIDVGTVPVGGDAPVSVQSMTNTATNNIPATLAQIRALAKCGCEIVRIAVPDVASADALPSLIQKSPVPLVADIHFNHQLALRSIDAGIAAVRINPGNIGSAEKIRQVAEAAGEKGIPIRIGVNGGSLPAGLLEEERENAKSPEEALAKALCRAALEEAACLEAFHFTDIILSLKASSVPVTVAANRMIAERTDYPLHLGITEAGTPERGIVKSAAGIGTLLLEGIGDTVRVSLTAAPCEEPGAAIALLESLGLRSTGTEIVSCPTCARTVCDVPGLAAKVESLAAVRKQAGTPLDVKKIAVMGCVVNGPGEARDADFGIAGAGHGKLMLFSGGKDLGTYPEEEALKIFFSLLDGKQTPRGRR